MRSFVAVFITLLLSLTALPPACGAARLQPRVNGTPPNLAAPGRAQTVLVLGSGGLVGRALSDELLKRGFLLIQVPGRLHTDLRIVGSLSWLDDKVFDFVFFLACEVGGSKFLTSASAQDAVRLYNERIYANVFPWLKARGAPFLFASSMLAAENTTYGTIKARGEVLTKSSGVGKSFRLYNVFGREPISTKSHVLSDWTYLCLQQGAVAAMTDGLEERQFAHAKDVAVALSDMMMHFDTLKDLTDVATGEWVSLRTIAERLVDAVGGTCHFSFSSSKSNLGRGVEPTNVWRVHSPLDAALRDLSHFYKIQLTREKLRGVPYLSVVVPALPGGDVLLDAFARHVYNASRSAHLDVEVMAVDCAPSFNTRPFEEHNVSRDLPLPQRFAWLPSRPLGDFHVISWENSGDACRWDAVGMHHARGAHVLFTNSSMRFPIALLEQIAHRRLPHRTVHVHTLALGGGAFECGAAMSNLGTCMAGDEARCLLAASEQERLSRSEGLTGAHGELLIVPKAGISSADEKKMAEVAFTDSAACLVQSEVSDGVSDV
jgi:nucleoside-diphosphate-sugar epimerase